MIERWYMYIPQCIYKDFAIAFHARERQARELFIRSLNILSTAGGLFDVDALSAR